VLLLSTILLHHHLLLLLRLLLFLRLLPLLCRRRHRRLLLLRLHLLLLLPLPLLLLHLLLLRLLLLPQLHHHHLLLLLLLLLVPLLLLLLFLLHLRRLSALLNAWNESGDINMVIGLYAKGFACMCVVLGISLRESEVLAMSQYVVSAVIRGCRYPLSKPEDDPCNDPTACREWVTSAAAFPVAVGVVVPTVSACKAGTEGEGRGL